MSNTREQLEAVPAEIFKKVVLEIHKKINKALHDFSEFSEIATGRVNLGECDGLTIIITVTNDPEVIGEE